MYSNDTAISDKDTPPVDKSALSLVDVRLGDLSVRLANSPAEINAAQSLRYKIFYQELGAKPPPDMARLERDHDHFDQFCDHLLVIDHNRDDAVVGTYRLIRRPLALAHGGFYTASEYDITCLEAYPGEVLELGRSCVDKAYRNGATMQLLWRGIAAYTFAYGIEIMFGCASFAGTDPQAHKLALSYLYHYHLAPEHLRAIALPERRVDMNFIAKDDIDQKEGLAALPPLLKGYLRVGGTVGDGAVIDWQFNTTDVCMIVKTETVSAKYMRHYQRSMPPTPQVM